jgi:hypothetical protein
MGGVPKCDFGNAHKFDGVFYDARVPAYRQWAILCPKCAKKHDIKLGTGLGQKYEHDFESGHWVKVEG